MLKCQKKWLRKLGVYFIVQQHVDSQKIAFTKPKMRMIKPYFHDKVYVKGTNKKITIPSLYKMSLSSQEEILPNRVYEGAIKSMKYLR